MEQRQPYGERPSRDRAGAAGQPPARQRTAALAGTRKHLGPLHQQDELQRAAQTAARAEARQAADGERRHRGGDQAGSARRPAPHRTRPEKQYYVQRGMPSPLRHAHGPSRRPSPLPLAGAGVALALAIGGGAWFAMHGAPAEPEATLGSLAASSIEPYVKRVTMQVETPRAKPTPVEEWEKGTVPFLFQTDPAWAGEPYAGETIAVSGCGPTSLSMVYVGLTGKTDMDPIAMASYSESNGYVQEGMTAWTLFTEGAAELGISGESLPSWEPTVREELEAGKPLVFNVLPGSAFTPIGHYIVATGVDDEGRVLVHDPNSYIRSSMTWDLQYLIDNSSNIWAFELA